VSKFELPEKQLERTKLLVKPTWSEKMTVLSTFLEFSLNFQSNNLKKHYKIWYSLVFDSDDFYNHSRSCYLLKQIT